MFDAGILERLVSYGVRRRAGQRGPSRRCYFTLCARRAKYRVWWWPDGTVRFVERWAALPSGGYSSVSQPLWRKPKMKRVTAAGGEDAPRSHASMASGGLEQLPGLIEHLAVIKYDDHAPRKPGAIRVTVEGAEWCVRVSDPDSCMSFVAKAETLWDALLQAELLIGSNRCPWSPDTFLREQAEKKKKK